MMTMNYLHRGLCYAVVIGHVLSFLFGSSVNGASNGRNDRSNPFRFIRFYSFSTVCKLFAFFTFIIVVVEDGTLHLGLVPG